jgi:NAD-dependent deacetylase
MDVERVARRLRKADQVVLLTGAGVSAESGIPTFRDALTGLWARFRPEDLATPEAFERDPRTVWQWYAERRAHVARAHPNAAHYAIARMETLVPCLTLVTQNVDGLHQRAGSRLVLELHGSIVRTRCSQEGRIVETWAEGRDVPPRCPSCRAALRPDVVWFGESLPSLALEEATRAAAACDLMLVVGTSGLVYPAAAIPHAALSAGVPVCVIDPADVPLGSINGVLVLRGAAGHVLPALLDAAWGEEAIGFGIEQD